MPPVLYTWLKSEDINSTQYLEELIKTLIQIQSKAYTNTLSSKTADQKCISSKRKDYPNYNIGDHIFFQITHGLNHSNKLAPYWDGPFVIIEKTSFDAYTIKCL